MDHLDFTYDNRTGRGPGRVVRTLRAVLPGVSTVWDQVEPYAAAWRTQNLSSLGRPGPRWVVLGDSMSQGIGASTYDTGWVGQLARRLGESGMDLPVVNLSATGARVDDVLHQQLPALESLGVGDDDLVTVMVGSNDLLGRSARAKLPGAFADLVDRLPTGSVVATLPQPGAATRRANRHAERAAAQGRIVLLDLRLTGPASWRGLLATDFFHPNDAGYAAIATAFEPTVRARLS